MTVSKPEKKITWVFLIFTSDKLGKRIKYAHESHFSQKSFTPQTSAKLVTGGVALPTGKAFALSMAHATGKTPGEINGKTHALSHVSCQNQYSFMF